MKSDPKRRGRLSATDWVQAGLDLLAEAGVVGVRIDTLARRLGVTKGSFYWHFPSRDELLEAMARYWADQEVGALVDEIEALDGDPVQRMELMFAIYHQRNMAPHDRAMRAWAQGDSRAARAVAQASRRVDALLRAVFEQMGFSAEDARLRSRILVLCGVGSIFAPEVPTQGDEGDDLRRRFFELITRPVEVPV